MPWHSIFDFESFITLVTLIYCLSIAKNLGLLISFFFKQKTHNNLIPITRSYFSDVAVDVTITQNSYILGTGKFDSFMTFFQLFFFLAITSYTTKPSYWTKKVKKRNHQFNFLKFHFLGLKYISANIKPFAESKQSFLPSTKNWG